MGQGIDLSVLSLPVYTAQARKRVLPVNVHGARAANALSTRASEGEGGIHLILNLDERVKNLGRLYWTVRPNWGSS